MTQTAMKPECVRKISNWSTIKAHHKFEAKQFDPNKVKSDLPVMSPKINDLLRRIAELDAADMKKEKKLFKHFIFSDVKAGGYGSKILTSAFLSHGYNLIYDTKHKLIDDKTLLENNDKNNFALLCSTGVFKKAISTKLKKDILAKFNQRPDNIHGDIFRFIIMDSGYKEGIDLFDVKYVHILEPQISRADEKQVIGRGTRTCGQRGLQFHPNNGWPLEVYIYDLTLSDELMKSHFFDTRTLFQLYLKYSNIDLRKVNFAAQLEKAAIAGSVDYELNKNIHNFKLRGEEMDINKIFSGEIDDMKGGVEDDFCKNKCGKVRATKAVPISTAHMVIAFFGMGGRFKKPLENPQEVRAYLCGLMKSDTDFCESLHDIREDVTEFVMKNAEDLMKAVEDKAHEKLPKRYRSEVQTIVRNLIDKIKKMKHPLLTHTPVTPVTPTSPKDKSSPKSPIETPESPESPDTPKEQKKKKHTPTPVLTPSPSLPGSPTKHNRGFLETRAYVKSKYNIFKWPKVEFQNLCGGAQQKGGASTIMTLNPTQNFVSNYFTPEEPIKGMLLFHSVGTGKTCTAIATASKFEEAGYTILWVTRTTLKADIWKNMFDQVCSKQIADKIKEGVKIPTEPSARRRLLSNSWSIQPMSYKQFSNMVAGNNSFYKDLVKKNGKEDPLKKTLLIIDEAHKLYGGADLSSIERPDMNKLKKAIHTSYKKSGDESVKVLLMTATPYTNDPMELIKLVNLLKPKGDQIPDNFDTFAEKYLNSEGIFTRKGGFEFLNDISGYISYLNRENDARQFAQPIRIDIRIPMSESVEKDTTKLIEIEDDIIEAKDMIDENKLSIKEKKKESKQAIKDTKARYKVDCKGLRKQKREECLAGLQDELDEIEKQLEDDIDMINDEIENYKKQIKDLRKEKTKIKKELKEDTSQKGVLLDKCVIKEKKPKKKRGEDTETDSDDEYESENASESRR